MRIRVPRKGVTQAELAAVLSRRLGGGYEVEPNGDGDVTVRRSSLSGAVVEIGDTRRVADALRRSPEFRSV